MSEKFDCIILNYLNECNYLVKYNHLKFKCFTIIEFHLLLLLKNTTNLQLNL